jgi:hypothetical protein
MLIADYIAISVLIALALWAGAKWVLFNPKPRTPGSLKVTMKDGEVYGSLLRG